MNDIVESNHEAILNYCNEAADAMRAGKPEHALTQLTRAFSLAYDSESVRLTAYVLTALGHAYFQTGNLQRAEECFTSAYKSTAESHPDLALMAAAGLARALIAKGDSAAALSYFQQAAGLAETVGNPVMSASLRGELADLLMAQGQTQAALDAYQALLKASRTMKRTDLEATALVGTARAAHQLDAGDITPTVNKALVVLRSVDDAELQASLRPKLREVMQAIGLSEGMISAELALLDAWIGNDQKGIVAATTRIAEMQLEAGDTQAAAETLQTARSLAQEANDPAAEARIVGLIAATHEQSGFAYMAFGLYEEQAALAAKTHNRELELAAITNLSAAYDRGGNAAKAIEVLNKAIMLAKVKVDAGLEASLMHQQAQLHAKLGNNDAALEQLDRSKKLLANGANPSLLQEIEAMILSLRGNTGSRSLSSRFA